jgi:2-dehydro-3-deoxy-D-arabinonate dehydratase
MAVDGQWLSASVTLSEILRHPAAELRSAIAAMPLDGSASGPLLPPVEPLHEVWACGVTYLRSREAREAESTASDVYARVYTAARPEQFFKSIGWRVVGHGMPIRVRADSTWNVPEPELTLVINRAREIVGYTVGNDVSSRDIEGENPLYLPQAKVYDGACAIGPGIVLAPPDSLRDLPIGLTLLRGGRAVFEGETRTSQMKRTFEELAEYATRETAFPDGLLLMTGTGVVPPMEFSMQSGDRVRITIGELTLENEVAHA